MKLGGESRKLIGEKGQRGEEILIKRRERKERMEKREMGEDREWRRKTKDSKEEMIGEKMERS